MQNEMRAVLKEFTYELKTDIVNEMKTVINGEFKEGLKTELRDEITEGFKNEIRNSEERIGLRLDGMDQRFDGIDRRLDGMDQRFDGIDHRLSNVENDVTSIKLTIENEIKPNICKIAEGYALLEERLDREALEEREYRKRIDYRLAALANQN